MVQCILGVVGVLFGRKRALLPCFSRPSSLSQQDSPLTLVKPKKSRNIFCSYNTTAVSTFVLQLVLLTIFLFFFCTPTPVSFPYNGPLLYSWIDFIIDSLLTVHFSAAWTVAENKKSDKMSQSTDREISLHHHCRHCRHSSNWGHVFMRLFNINTHQLWHWITSIDWNRCTPALYKLSMAVSPMYTLWNSFSV